ncbi:hypothetical protein CRM22_010913, partial [Opisthorchis felineus]
MEGRKLLEIITEEVPEIVLPRIPPQYTNGDSRELQTQTWNSRLMRMTSNNQMK